MVSLIESMQTRDRCASMASAPPSPPVASLTSPHSCSHRYCRKPLTYVTYDTTSSVLSLPHRHPRPTPRHFPFPFFLFFCCVFTRSLRMYNNLVEKCFATCVQSFRRKTLEKDEERVRLSSRAPPRQAIPFFFSLDEKNQTTYRAITVSVKLSWRYRVLARYLRRQPASNSSQVDRLNLLSSFDPHSLRSPHHHSRTLSSIE